MLKTQSSGAAMPPRWSRALSLGLALIFLCPLAARAQLSPEDVVSLRQVTSVALSPDGQTIAYTVTHPRAADDEVGPAYSELFLLPVEGGDPTPIIERPQTASSPTWMPDGRLAFAANLEAHDEQQVYAVSAPGDEPELLTDASEGVMRFAFTPDGEAVAYTARQPVPEDVQQRQEQGYDMIVRGGEDAYEQHILLYLQPLDASQRRALTPADRSVRDFALAPDGETVAVQMTDETGVDADYMFRRLYTLPLEGGEPELITSTEGRLGPMAWSPDGEHLAFLGAIALNDPLPHSVFVVPAEGGPAQNLTEGYAGTAEWVGWLNEETVVFAGVESTRTAVNRVHLEDDDPERIFGDGLDILRSLSLADDRQSFAAPVHTRDHPAEVYYGHLGTGDLERLTHHNDFLRGRQLGRQETIQWSGADDALMEGVVTYPLDYREGERYPLVVLPHGGPEGISIDGWNTRPLYPAHVLATEGYVVFEPNYRGSGGRGPAFSMANHRDLGGKEFEDVLLGIDHLTEEGMVDPDRVGISGTSYGGYFAAWAGTRYPDRFAAAITFAGLSNWISFTGTTDIPNEMTLVHWDLWWWDSPGLAMDRSPVSFAHRTDTPILVASGQADERVHPEQALQLYEFLRLNDVPSQLVLYPREPHGLLERAHQLDFMERTLDWFDRYVKNGPPALSD